MNKSLFIAGLMLVALTACGEKKVEEMAPAADQAAPATEHVITSYSIHYTKLYDGLSALYSGLRCSPAMRSTN